MSLFYLNLDREQLNRFDMGAFFDYSDTFDPLTSEFLYSLKKLSVSGKYVVQSEVGKPDLISYRIYNDPQYWWILLAYNNIIDVESVVIGLVLEYPSLSDLESLYFSLKTKQVAG